MTFPPARGQIRADLRTIENAVRRVFDAIDPPKPATTAEPIRLVAAQRIVEQFRLRDIVLAGTPAELKEPAWRMLVEIYLADAREGALSVSSACYAAGCSMTTALRHQGQLECRGLVTRIADPTDARRVYLHLTAVGRELLDRYFEKLGAGMQRVSSH